MVWGDYILVLDQHNLLKFGIRDTWVTTDHRMILSCLWGVGSHHNQRQQKDRTTWTIVPPTGGGAGGKNVIRSSEGVNEPQERRKEEVNLDIRGHMVPCVPNYLPTPSHARVLTRPPHSNQTLPGSTPRRHTPPGKFIGGGGRGGLIPSWQQIIHGRRGRLCKGGSATPACTQHRPHKRELMTPLKNGRTYRGDSTQRGIPLHLWYIPR